MRKHTVPLIICCIPVEQISLAPVVAVCSATLSVSSLYFNPHGHAETVFFILSTATARVGSVMPLHFTKRSAQGHITMVGQMTLRESHVMAVVQRHNCAKVGTARKSF